MASLVSLIEKWQLAGAFAGLAAMLLWETSRPFFELFSDRRSSRRVHLARNLALGLVNSAVIALGFVSLWLVAAEWADENGVGVLNWLERFGLPGWAHAVGAILVLDCWTYVWHRLNHRIRFLWRFHRVHHSDMRMDVTTASRFHTGEIILSSALRIPLILVTGAYAWELLLYEAMMFAVVQFHHANIAVAPAMDRLLRMVIVTPAMHKVHHSNWRPETDSNYSAFLSIWDRLFQSFRLRKQLETIEFGLKEFRSPEDERLGKMLTMPLRSAAESDESGDQEAGLDPTP